MRIAIFLFERSRTKGNDVSSASGTVPIEPDKRFAHRRLVTTITVRQTRVRTHKGKDVAVSARLPLLVGPLAGAHIFLRNKSAKTYFSAQHGSRDYNLGDHGLGDYLLGEYGPSVQV